MSFRITLYSDNIPHDLYSLEKYGLGGSESALTNLAWEFAILGHEVTVLCQTTQSHKYKNIVCHPLDSAYKKQALNCDLFISLRSGVPFISEDLSKAGLKVFWSQDTRYCSMTEHLFVNTGNMLSNIDKIVVISDYAYNHFSKENIANINDKLIKIQNGYQDKFIVKPEKDDEIINCIYTSQPSRGLEYLVDVWPVINKEVPNSKLHLYSSTKLYGQQEDRTNEWMFVRARRYPSIEIHEPVCQKELFQKYSTMDVLLYPNIYPESGCMALKEAMANSCTSVVTNLGALVEKTKRGVNGAVVCGHPATEIYQTEFIAQAVDLLSNREKLRQYQKASYETVKDWTWQNKAKEWLDILKN